MTRLRSLTLRLALLTGLGVSAGLFAAWLFVTHEAAQALERSFDGRLHGLLATVAAGVALDTDDAPTFARAFADSRFASPFSGTYWQIETEDGRVFTSPSLAGSRLALPLVAGEKRKPVHLAGPHGQHLRLVERTLSTRSGQTLRVAVAMAYDGTDREIDRLTHGLAFGFALLGAGLVAGTVLAISLVLAPLRRLRREVAALRAGERERLSAAAGAEVEPLISEIEALVAQNRATVERARGHVGNLAHALRTALAVLRNTLDHPEGVDLTQARTQLAAAEELVAHHLARARSAALVGAAASDIAPLEVAREIAAALRRLFAERAVSIDVRGEAALRVRCDRQDLAEMLGNLMENACKWAVGSVLVQVSAAVGAVRVTVEDDGPGLPQAALPLALARGGRLDEKAPGSGLGLAIVTDLAALYGGSLALAKSARGGLAATLTLPAGRSS